MPVLNPNDFIFVTLLSNRPGWQMDDHRNWNETNPGQENTPLTVGWNGRETHLQIGKKVFVQLEAATNAFGDPRSAVAAQAIPMGDPQSGERLFIPDRASEVRRLRLRYGILDGNDTDFYNVHGVFLAPRVKLETESGDEIISVLDDPHGNTVNQVATTVQQNSDKDALFEHLTKQVEALTLLVQGKQDANPAPSLDELPADFDPATADLSPVNAGLAGSDTFDELPDDT